jgi:hypothetical protein
MKPLRPARLVVPERRRIRRGAKEAELAPERERTNA